MVSRFLWSSLLPRSRSMQVIIEFLKTGRYRWWVPFISSVRFTDARAPTANDFVGLNYYRSAASCLLLLLPLLWSVPWLLLLFPLFL